MLEIHTEPPIVELHFPNYELNGVRIYMKREDLLHPHVSGNKWRKLKYVLADAYKSHKQHLISFGGAYSNHLLALACAAKMFGFEATAFVRGEEVTNKVLSQCAAWGMRLIFVSRMQYQNKFELYETYFGNNSDAYFIDEGGRGKLAAKGCEEILDGVEGYTHIICPVGTGTTLAGLAVSAKLKGLTAEGICVLKGAEEITRDITNLSGIAVKVHHEFHRGGYAKTDPPQLSFMHTFYQQNGFALDEVYTAKMVMGVLELINRGYYSSQHRLLLIHTGGLWGNTRYRLEQ